MDLSKCSSITCNCAQKININSWENTTNIYLENGEEQKRKGFKSNLIF